MNRQQAKKLLEKYNKGTASADERNLVDSWFLHLKSNQSSWGSSEEMIDRNTDEVWSVLKEHMPKRKTTFWIRIAATAAVIVVILGAGVWYLGNTRKIESVDHFANDIAPGKNGATLTLANGKKIRLADVTTGALANEAGILISKNEAGSLIYEIQETVSDPNAINVLSTDKGETSQVILPDGSVVYLNAASSLTYTTSLIRNGMREVALSGEAYFEIAKDRQHPFVVKTAKQEVEVLGTHFNISSYADDEVVKTTLVKGSVKVSASGSSSVLKPGQLSALRGSRLTVENADIEMATSWKNGLFVFNDEQLGSIMKKISRWYNVNVHYADARLATEEFWGSISRTDNILEVLNTLEGTGQATFKIKDRSITVYPYAKN